MGLLVAFAAFALGSILGESELARFERKAGTEIASRLEGPQRHVVVKARPNGIAGLWGDLSSATIQARDFQVDGLPLFTEPEFSRSGRIGTLRLDLREFRLRGLLVESLVAEIPGCRYDFGRARRGVFRLSRSGEGTGTVRIRQDDLAAFILRKFPEIKRVTVQVRDDIVWVEGYGEFLLVTSGFTVIAQLSAEGGTRLNLTNAKVYFDWRRADPVARQALLDFMNPVVDLQADLGLYDAVSVERIRLRDGVLEASGRTRIPNRPAPDRQ